MRILVACEFSGVVRNAFAELGHDAWSCDLLPSEKPGKHIQGDVLKFLDGRVHEYAVIGIRPWDLIIAHPPCTFLCNSGVRWLAPSGKLDSERHREMMTACDFFATLYNAPIAHVCVENPIMHHYAKSYLWLKHEVPDHTQTIQPYEHGHGETKRTCLWLRGLPDLKPSNIVSGRNPRVHHATPGANRWKERSRTLPGIASAMAQQWGRNN